MDVGLAVFASAMGSAGLFTLIQFFVERHDTKDRDLAQIKNSLKKIDSKCDRNELATTRLQLIFLIDSQPQNVDTIMATAQRYFVELKGNGEAWALFNKWAKENDINTDWYLKILAREEGK